MAAIDDLNTWTTFEDWRDFQGNSVHEFAQNYRQAMGEQLEASNKQTEQERRNQQAAIMSAANRAGMMYSNFPARQKIMYDTSAYYPGLTSNQQTYQSALDRLRDNMVSYWNNMKTLQQKIDDLNYMQFDY